MSEQVLRALNRIAGKFQRDVGLVIWGEVEGAEGTYAKILVKSDGTIKVEATISGDIDVSDRWARQLGQVDIARYLGSAMGLANPLHSQIVVSGAVIDPRSIRALTASDVVSAAQSGAWTIGVNNFPSTYDVSDRAARLLGIVYGSQSQQLLQRATTYDLIVQLRSAGVEIDPTQIRTLTTSDQVTAFLGTADLWTGRIKIGDGTNLLAVPQAGDAIGRGVFIYGSDYGSPTAAARIAKVDSSGRLSCVLG